MSSLEFLFEGFAKAVELIFTLNPYVISVTQVQLKVSGIAVLLSALTAIALATLISFRKFVGKGLLITIINTFMGLPPVIVGLVVFILLSTSGPLGFLNLIYTPTAMIITQYILATPIITGVAISAIGSVEKEIGDTALTLGASKLDMTWLVIKEAKLGIITAILAGFGRAIAEVGSILIVGGNIAFADGTSYTRTLTTAITIETAMGNFATAIALGIILISLALAANFAVNILQRRTED